MINKATSFANIDSMLATIRQYQADAAGKNTPAVLTPATPEVGKPTFGDAIHSAISKTNDTQQYAGELRQAYDRGEEVPLTAYEYKVLEYFMLNPTKVISKTELTEHIYDQDFDLDSNVIEVFVLRLRKKLDPDGELKPIETLRGRGYRFNLAIN